MQTDVRILLIRGIELKLIFPGCVICYNEYGIEAPEGIKEVPLRLPKCGHIFGDHCIKKWFEDSDSCPYCRDKLHAVPKTQSGSSARAYMDLMRLRGIHIPPG